MLSIIIIHVANIHVISSGIRYKLNRCLTALETDDGCQVTFGQVSPK